MTSASHARGEPEGTAASGNDAMRIDQVDSLEPIAYPVHFGDDVIAAVLPGMIGDRRVLVVTTPTVHASYGRLLVDASGGRIREDDFLVLGCREATKDMRQVEAVCRRGAGMLDRNSLLVAFGGGVVMDIACFAASMIRRGIAHVKIPTTLIGQVDAGIGVKGGVNFGARKSFLGCFRAPEGVLIQPDLLASLPPRHLSAGLAEMIKMAIVADGALFDLIEDAAPGLLRSGFREPRTAAQGAIVQSIRLMLGELRQNLTERQGYRRIVDFGHTFSPALEAASDFALPHGFAVSVDMALSAALALERGTLAERHFTRIVACLGTARLPVWDERLSLDLCHKALLDTEAHRGGDVNLVVPAAIGSAEFIAARDDIDPVLLARSLDRIRAVSAQQAA